MAQVLWEIRLPRSLGARLAGALLGLGAVVLGAMKELTMPGSPDNTRAIQFYLPGSTGILGCQGGHMLAVVLVLCLLLSLCGRRALNARLQVAEGEVRLGGRAMSAWSAREGACQRAWMRHNESGAEGLAAFDVVMLGRLPHRA